MWLDEYPQTMREMISLAVIFFLMFINHFFIGPLPKVLLSLLICATYFMILFIPKTWWTRMKVILAAMVVVVETVSGIYLFHEINLIDMLFVIIFYVTTQFSLSKSALPVIMAMLLAAMLYIHLGRESLFNIISFVLLTIVLYFTIRIRIQRNEMYRVNKQQLKELQSAYEQLQEASVTAMQFAILEERTRIAREIHDAVGHGLTSLIVQIQALKYMIKKDPIAAERSLDEMLIVARQGLKDIRNSVHSLADNQTLSGIAPLKALLSRMKASASIQFEFHSEINDEELTTPINGLLFKVLQEAVTNIIRHSKATLVNVSLEKACGNIVMRISDNGILDSNGTIDEGFGLKGMKSRLEERGGRLNYSALEPNGFEIVAEIPLDCRETNGVNEG